jgi:hypothetical protein
MMQLITNVGDREPVNHLGVRRGAGIQIHRPEVIRLVNPGACKINHHNPSTQKIQRLQDPHINSAAHGFCCLQKSGKQKPCEHLQSTETVPEEVASSKEGTCLSFPLQVAELVNHIVLIYQNKCSSPWRIFLFNLVPKLLVI